jgi:two-component system chemotaxis sensor kinase CheA
VTIDAAISGLLDTFFDESFEGLDRAEAALLQLGDAAGGVSAEVIGDLFRAIHSIKGGAGAFGVDEVTGLAHAMESVLDDVRGGAPATADGTTALLVGVDELRRALDARRAGKPIAAGMHAALIAQLAALREATAAAAVTAVADDAAVAEGSPAWRVRFAPHVELMRCGNDPVRILRELAELGATDVVADTSRVPALAELDATALNLAWTLRLPGTVSRAQLDDVFAWVDGQCELTLEREQAVSKAQAVAAAPAAPPAAAPASVATSGGSLRVGVDKVDLLMNMVGELVITQSMLGELDDDGPLSPDRVGRIREGLSLLARTTRALQESVVRLRSMPVGVVFARLPRIVHDLGRRLGKDIAISLAGESTELDRTVLEKLGDPLVHIVRNSIDHGIETPAERVAAGKPAQGTVTVRAEHRGSTVAIEISDDGRGLDLPRILATAKARGLVAPDAQPHDDDIAKLIFAPGFSTAAQVSEVSGRGVGMDVVWRHIKELRGEVTLDSTPGRGTRTVLSLPLTLAIIEGQLVRLGDQTYVVPLLSILETVEYDSQPRRRWGVGDVIRLRDQIVPVVDLAAQLGIATGARADHRLLMIVEAEGAPIGLVVDELLAQQQVVIKSLETNFGRVDGLAGATILGDGQVAFILDIVALARDVRRTGRTADPASDDLQAA